MASPITPLFLTKDEIGPALNMSESKARATLDKYGVKPVDRGRGRGNGLRWRTSAVIQVADTLHAEAQNRQAKNSSRLPRKRPLLGRSAAEVFAEISRGQPVQ